MPEMSDRYSLADLCRIVDVTPRTVRYYVAQGLLPPPSGSGPAARYSEDHLHRLRLIRRLQRQHMPLADIRARLAVLTEADVRGLIEEAPVPSPPDDSALDYIRSILGTVGALDPGRPVASPVAPTRAQPRAYEALRQSEPARPMSAAIRGDPALESDDEPAPPPGAASVPPGTASVPPGAASLPAPASTRETNAGRPGQPGEGALDPGEPGSGPEDTIGRKREGSAPSEGIAAGGSPLRSQWDRLELSPDVELHIRRPLSRIQNRRVERLIAIARELLEED